MKSIMKAEEAMKIAGIVGVENTEDENIKVEIGDFYNGILFSFDNGRSIDVVDDEDKYTTTITVGEDEDLFFESYDTVERTIFKKGGVIIEKYFSTVEGFGSNGYSRERYMKDGVELFSIIHSINAWGDKITHEYFSANGDATITREEVKYSSNESIITTTKDYGNILVNKIHKKGRKTMYYNSRGELVYTKSI